MQEDVLIGEKNSFSRNVLLGSEISGVHRKWFEETTLEKNQQKYRFLGTENIAGKQEIFIEEVYHVDAHLRFCFLQTAVR